MVGRERQLDALRDVAARAGSGEPGTALVLGEAGVGKTRLVNELVAELETQGFLCPVSHGVDLAGGELPFGATTELLRSLIRSVGVSDARRLLGAHAPMLGALVPTLGQPQQGTPVDRAMVFGSILTLLEGLGRPVCWVLDDLQWMDAATRDLVSYLSRVLMDVPVLLLATIRADGATPGDLPDTLVELGRICTVVALQPLEPHEVAAQVAGIVDTELEPAEVARICEVSDGLPFFVEQLVASGGTSTGSLRAVVLTGLTGLTGGARALLEAAAVGEGLLLPTYLQAVTGLDDHFGPAVAETREHGVLRLGDGRDQLHFRHALLREAIDAELTTERRTALHAAWANVIEDAMDTAPPDPLHVMERARHRHAVGGPGAFAAALAAAQVVEAIADQGLQAQWWGRTLALWPGPARDRDVEGVSRDWALFRLVAALWGIGKPDEFSRLLAGELAGESDWLRCRWLQLLQRQVDRELQRDYDPVIPPADADRVLARLRGSGPDLRVTTMLILLADDWNRERPDLVPAMLEEALRRAQAEEDHDAVMEAFSLLGGHEAAQGRPDSEIELCRRALEWVQQHRPAARLTAKNYLTACLVNNGHYDEAVELAESVLQEIGDPRLLPTLWVGENIGLAVASSALGDWDRALAAVAAGDIPASGGRADAGRRWAGAVIHARRGERALAEAELAAMPESPASAPRGFQGSMEGIFRALATLEIAAAAHDVEAVRSASLRVAQLTHPGDAPLDVWEAFAAGLRAGVARAGTDEATADYVAAVARDVEHRVQGGRIADACRLEIDAHLARMTDTDTSGQWRAVVDLWQVPGRVYDVAYVRVFEAECALRDGDREHARAALADAREACEHLGAVPLLTRVNATARRGRLDIGDDIAASAGLTAREVEVLGLLADGRTNAQVAEALVMSPKTASVHVSHIIAKLGLTNRTEAAAYAHRNGFAASPV